MSTHEGICERCNGVKPSYCKSIPYCGNCHFYSVCKARYYVNFCKCDELKQGQPITKYPEITIKKDHEELKDFLGIALGVPCLIIFGAAPLTFLWLVPILKENYVFVILAWFIMMMVMACGAGGGFGSGSSSPKPARKQSEYQGVFGGGKQREGDRAIEEFTGRIVVWNGSRGCWIDEEGHESEGSVRYKDGKIEYYREADHRWVSEAEYDEYCRQVREIKAARNRADDIAAIEALKRKG